MMRRFLALAVAAMTLTGVAQDAYADCTSPAGIAGALIYNTAFNRMQYCNGTSWIDASQKTASGSSGVPGLNMQVLFNDSNALGSATQLLWDSGNNRLGIGSTSLPNYTLDVTGAATTTTLIMNPMTGGGEPGSESVSNNSILYLLGDITAAGPGSAVATIKDRAVTYAKLQNVTAASRLLGRVSGIGDPQEITLGTNLTMSGTTLNGAATTPAGTSGYIQLSNGSGGFSTSSTTAGQQLFWDNTNKRLGIRNVAPGQTVDVTGNIRVSGEIQSSNPTVLRMVYGNYGSMWYNDGGVTYFLLTNSGDQYGAYNALRPFSVNNATGDVFIADAKFKVAHTGELGIGTTSPASAVHINASQGHKGVMVIDTGTGMGVHLEANHPTVNFNNYWDGSTVRNIGAGHSAEMKMSPTTGALSFTRGGNAAAGAVATINPRMVIQSDGIVRINTSNTWAMLTIESSGVPVTIRHTGATAGRYWKFGPDTSANNFRIYSEANVGRYITYGGTTWTSSSDERLKTDIETLPDALDKITALRGVSYRWRDETDKTTHLGVIAQDVQKVYPELVSTGDKGYLGVAYEGLIAPLLQAINELKAKNDALLAKRAELKQRLTALEAAR